MTEPSPLAEATPDSLEVLFARDPLSYSQEDRLRIITEFRRIRARLAQAPASAPKAAKTPREAKRELSLDDLIGE